MSTVIIAGATGYTGLAFTRAFANAVADPYSSITKVYALVEQSSLSDPAKVPSIHAALDIPNVEIITASFDNPESLMEALKDVDIVVSTLAGEDGIPSQLSLIEAAKIVGVKRFVPSDYATDARTTPLRPLMDLKLQVHKALFDSGLNYTIIDLGGYFSNWISGLGVPKFSEGIPVEPVLIYGEGNQLADFIDISDIAAYTVRAVVDPCLEKKRLWLDNKSLTQLEIVKTWEEIIGRQIQKKFVSREEADKEYEQAKGCHTFLLRLPILVWFEGVFVKPSDYLTASEVYPDIAAKTKSVKQYLTEVSKRI